MRVELEDKDHPVFMISVVSKMLSVHPQTLRLYERLGLIIPQRTQGKTRLYSSRDIERLRLIQKLTRDRRVNLAGVGMILKMQQDLDQLKQEMQETLELLKKNFYEETGPSSVSSEPPKASGVRIKIESG